MEFNEKLTKLRKEAGLSQEQLAAKIFVSRTLITKYESGSVFPTDENLKKIAEVLEVEVKDILSDEEKSKIVQKSYKNLNKFWMILQISMIVICVLLLVFSLIPFYRYGHYVYPIPEGQSQPDFIHGYASIISSTLKDGNPISLINVVFFVASIISSVLTFANLNIKSRKIVRIVSLSLFAVSIILFFFSFGSMISLMSTNDFQMNSRISG